MKSQPLDIVLTAEAARIAGVVPATVRWWARTGKLPVEQTTAGVRLFSRAKVLQLAKSRTQLQGEAK